MGASPAFWFRFPFMQLGSLPQFATLPEQIAKAIADGIMKNEIEPGANLREIPLAELFGVSRSSVREALRILERDGVVSIRPRHGAKVTELSAEEMAEIYQIRAALLGVAFELFAAQAVEENLKFLKETLARIKTIAATDEQSAALLHAELSASMATYICARGGNKKLAVLLNQMSLQIARYTKFGLSSASRRKQSIKNWETALDAFARQHGADSNRAGSQMVRDNLTYAQSVLKSTRP
ncbi:GntR family transcriptional regulator [Bordetella sp. BOR01]|uniref:GntR family transcriptional regulator n=1 Tax=Bordetella sp. BOR01 TaxID=2854779 RepID=UPI001C48C569|nr:GntR family transcriptional regulator [Bordetella sp. BOR01]MBV7484092.1 GntR family transcriptional regulator [Bordetella sp. BOR01]